MMKRILLGGLALLVVCTSPVFAGKNDGGAMLVHTDDAVSWTGTICNQFDAVVPQDYTQLGTQTDLSDLDPVLIWFIAAFHESATPGVSVVFFGNDHNLPEFYITRAGFCANGTTGSLEVPDTGWPDNPATAGNSVAFGSPLVIGDTLFPFYYFEVYGFTGAYFGSGINPTGGYAAFVDDSNPPVTDRTDKFGVVRWYVEGENSEPEPPRLGACCLSTEAGGCVIALESDCQPTGATYSGTYLGDDTVCEPGLCGACCYWFTADAQPPFFYDRRCVVTSAADCADSESWGEHEHDGHGSNWSYGGSICAGSEEHEAPEWWCETTAPIATETTSWGKLKSLYR